MTCGAANGYLCLSLCCEKTVRGHIRDAWGSLFKLRNITHFFFFGKILHQISLNSRSISIWSFVVMIFGTFVFILILLFMHKKCFHEKGKVYFGKRLADCSGNKNVVTSSLSVVENWLVSSEYDEIVRSKSGR